MGQDLPIGDRLPTLIVVSGPPGVGKSTLARRLGEVLPAPVLDKDTIKSGIVLTERRQALRLDPAGRAAIETLWSAATLLLASGCTTIVEAAFHREHFDASLAAVEGLGEIRLVCCFAPPHVAKDRYAQRARSAGNRYAHADAAVIAEMDARDFDWSVYDLRGIRRDTLVVDTSDGYQPSFEQIRSFVLDPVGGDEAWIFVETIETGRKIGRQPESEFLSRHPELHGVDPSCVRVDSVHGQEAPFGALRFWVHRHVLASPHPSIA